MNHRDRNNYGFQSITIKAMAPNLGLEDCIGVEHGEPCTIVIFGATKEQDNGKNIGATYKKNFETNI
jgi:hypothetical protein